MLSSWPVSLDFFCNASVQTHRNSGGRFLTAGAIAHNQKLRQLVSQKQYLEAKLKRASEALEVTRKALDFHYESASTLN